MYRPLRIIFVGDWITKVYQQPITQMLRDMSLEAANRLGTHLVIDAHHFSQLFGVELFGESGGAYQIAKHDSELPPLALTPSSV
jgi:hypothetical protein